MSAPDVAPAWRVRAILAEDITDVLGATSRCPEAAQWSGMDYERACGRDLEGWVAIRGGKVAGFVVARLLGVEMEILNLAVLPAYRRGGLGTQLLEAAHSRAMSSGARRVFLEVRESNTGAIAFYTRRGFAPAGRRRRYYANPTEDALVFSKSL